MKKNKKLLGLYVTSDMWDAMRDVDSDVESFLIFSGTIVEGKNTVRYMVAKVWIPSSDAIDKATICAIEIDEVSSKGLIANGIREGLHFIGTSHTHNVNRAQPESTYVRHSSVDDADDIKLAKLISTQTVSDMQVISTVVDNNAVDVRLVNSIGDFTYFDYVEVVGSNFKRINCSKADTSPNKSQLENKEWSNVNRMNILVPQYSELSAQCTVAVIGIGGAGSLMFDFLARNGHDLIAIDDGFIKPTDISRNALFDNGDIGKPKALTAKEKIDTMNLGITVEAYQLSITSEKNCALFAILADVSFAIECLDNAPSKLVFNRVTTQMYIPSLSLGSAILNEDALQMAGRSVISLPRKLCLECHPIKTLPDAEINNAFMDESIVIAMREQGYITTGEKRNELVASTRTLNSVYTGLAGIQFQSWLTGIMPLSIAEFIDITSAKYEKFYVDDPEFQSSIPATCDCCSRGGIGDLIPLPFIKKQGPSLKELLQAPDFTVTNEENEYDGF